MSKEMGEFVKVARPSVSIALIVIGLAQVRAGNPFYGFVWLSLGAIGITPEVHKVADKVDDFFQSSKHPPKGW